MMSLTPPPVGCIVQCNIHGYDDEKFVEEGYGYVDEYNDIDKTVRVYFFDRTRYQRKLWSQILIGVSEETYTLEKFYKFFTIINSQ